MAIRILLVILVLGVLAVSGGRLKAENPTAVETGEQSPIAEVLMASVDVVFRNHVDPPTRGELLHRGVKGILAQADVFRPGVLGRRISELEPTEYTAFLREMIGVAKRNGSTTEQLQAAFLDNLLDERREGAEIRESRLVTEEEYRVQQQLRENRYVGIGIALGQSGDRPVMMKVFPDGPASKSGARNGDVIVTIDGKDTDRMSVVEAVKSLRGSEGEALTLTVRQPEENTERTLDLVRGEVPFETVVGRVREDDGWRYDIEPTKKIAYIKIVSIRGSTVGELRATARRLRRASYEALILDLRRAQDGDLRHTIFLADELLGTASLGAYSDVHGTHDVNSNAESLFPELPLAVLVDAAMPDGASWIASTLQDNKRGVLVGLGTPIGDWYTNELTKLPMGAGALLLPTAILYRPNPEPSSDRCVIQWLPSDESGGPKYSKREHTLAAFLLQPGANSRSLIPDHFVGESRAPANRPSANNTYTDTRPDPTEDVAIEVLQERLEFSRTEPIAE